MLQIFLYSIVAGALIGLVRAALGGELISALKSTAAVATTGVIKPTGKFNIPFSAALLLAYLVNWTLTSSGGLL